MPNRPVFAPLQGGGCPEGGGVVSRKTSRIRFRGVRFRTPNSVSFFGAHRVEGSELSEFLSAYRFEKIYVIFSYVPSVLPKRLREKKITILHAEYDWMTGVPDSGNEWRKFRRRTSLIRIPRAFPCFCTLLDRGGNRRAFRLPGAGGDHFHCAVEPRPVILGVEHAPECGIRSRPGKPNQRKG